jgi:hypothetical protein
LADLLAVFHDAIVEYVLESPLIDNPDVVSALDELQASLQRAVVDGAIRVENTETGQREQVVKAQATVALEPSLTLEYGSRAGGATSRQTTQEGVSRLSLNFTEVTAAMRRLGSSLADRRVWLLLDEWSSVPIDIQPFLGEFLVRSVLPLSDFTVKIAAIEQQSKFRVYTDAGVAVGIELGADVAANLDLDEFMVFEQNEEHARSFFLGLFFKHLTLGSEDGQAPSEIRTERDVIRAGFTDSRAFDELVRAAEGVPRDAINIAAKAALRARDRVTSVSDVRFAARSWYQADKEAALRAHPSAPHLLNWLIDGVIGHRRARGFLVDQADAGDELLGKLYEARVLHVVRRGYSAQDTPGERYDVWVIDYGAYVDLLQTKSQPQGLLPLEGNDGSVDGYVNLDVPVQDLRSIRRAILHLREFEASRASRATSVINLASDGGTGAPAPQPAAAPPEAAP